MPLAICQNWQYTENDGPDFQRPDGYSLHITPDDHTTFINVNTKIGSYPLGKPFVVCIDTPTWQKLRRYKNGMRIFEPSPPSIDINKQVL